MNRIALFLPNWIGDVVMATPAIRAVRDTFPVGGTRRGVQALRRGRARPASPWFRDVILADKRGPRSQRLFAAARQLRANRPDAAMLFPNSFRTALLARLGGCRRVVGFARYGRRGLLTDRLLPKTDARGRLVPSPIIDDYNRLAVALGTADPGHRMELFTTPADEAGGGRGLGAVRRSAAIRGWSPVIPARRSAPRSTGRSRISPNWRGCSRQRPGCGVLVLCGPGERDMARRIVSESRSPHVFSFE